MQPYFLPTPLPVVPRKRVSTRSDTVHIQPRDHPRLTQESTGLPGSDWTMKRDLLSPHSTTKWADLPIVKAW
ncbi:DUF4113 domain-containing protein [Mesomycoplasma ovipneumoniae]|uniref:DUF4113 domain-containing protein n=1 Tax=Mesomycoplasma ovipneumoniae TaxID=29562 RepID=UPI0009C09FB3